MPITLGDAPLPPNTVTVAVDMAKGEDVMLEVERETATGRILRAWRIRNDGSRELWYETTGDST